MLSCSVHNWWCKHTNPVAAHRAHIVCKHHTPAHHSAHSKLYKSFEMLTCRCELMSELLCASERARMHVLTASVPLCVRVCRRYFADGNCKMRTNRMKKHSRCVHAKSCLPSPHAVRTDGKRQVKRMIKFMEHKQIKDHIKSNFIAKLSFQLIWTASQWSRKKIKIDLTDAVWPTSQRYRRILPSIAEAIINNILTRSTHSVDETPAALDIGHVIPVHVVCVCAVGEWTERNGIRSARDAEKNERSQFEPVRFKFNESIHVCVCPLNRNRVKHLSKQTRWPVNPISAIFFYRPAAPFSLRKSQTINIFIGSWRKTAATGTLVTQPHIFYA